MYLAANAKRKNGRPVLRVLAPVLGPGLALLLYFRRS